MRLRENPPNQIGGPLKLPYLVLRIQVPGNELRDFPRGRLVEFAIGERHQGHVVQDRHGRSVLTLPFEAYRSNSISSIRCNRARERRLMTVPIGTPAMSAVFL